MQQQHSLGIFSWKLTLTELVVAHQVLTHLGTG